MEMANTLRIKACRSADDFFRVTIAKKVFTKIIQSIQLVSKSTSLRPGTHKKKKTGRKNTDRLCFQMKTYSEMHLTYGIGFENRFTGWTTVVTCYKVEVHSCLNIFSSTASSCF